MKRFVFVALSLIVLIGSCSAFLTSQWSGLARKMSIRMTENADPWFPNTVAKNQVNVNVLEDIYKKATSKAQDFLEADPYWDNSNLPLQTFKAKEPHVAKIVSVKRIVGAQAVGETCNIVIDHFGKMPYWEGQSYGVIPPGINPKNGKPYTNRLYSIASTRYGDDFKGTTTTLCVRRATYFDPELGREDPSKKGVCSNFLCDAKPGDEIQLTGPAGKVMLMPEKNPNADLIMVATGTGIAPYRAFIRRLFVEDTPAARNFKGLAWLFLGVANKDSLLYDEDWQKIKEKFPDKFRVDYALSREQKNRKGDKMYIQDKVEEYADEIFERMEKGAHIYFCGLKGTISSSHLSTLLNCDDCIAVF